MKIVVLSLILLLVVVDATKFGSVHTKKIDKIKLAREYIDSWGSGDEEYMASFISEDFSADDTVTNQKVGKEGVLQIFRMLSSSLPSKSYRVKNCKIGKEGEVICSWDIQAKFAKEFMGIQPHHKYIHIGGVNVMHFNDQGLLTKATIYDRQAEYHAQMLGKTSQREEILELLEDWWNGKVPSSHVSLLLSKEFSAVNPFKKHSSWAEFEKFVEIFRQSSPHMTLDWTCDPSAEDFDVWICNYHSIQPIERDNELGLKKGAKIVQDGVSTIVFDEEGKLKDVETYFDLQDFMRQATTI